MNREFDNCGAHYVKGSGGVEIFPLDHLHLPVCDLFWLDVEGYEYMALAGAIDTIERCSPVIICEEKGLGKLHGVEIDAIGSLLASLGYKMRDKIGNDVIYMI